MTYAEFMRKAKELAIITDDEVGSSYLRPDYRKALYDNELTIDKITDFPNVTDEIVAEELRLDVNARNVKRSNINVVTDWLYEIITSTVDPIVTEEQNELIKNVSEYMQHSNELKDKEMQLQKKEETLDQKENVVQKIPVGLNFSKKKP